MPRLQGKVVVILGASADKSMGAATARRFAREGAKLILAARRVAPLEAIAGETGGTAIAADITQEEDLTRLADFAVTEHGKLDVAINFAGINSFAPVSDVTRQVLQDACNVHIIGATFFIKYMASRMANGGSIITTSSLTALVAPPGLAAYAGTKKAADQIVRIAAVELGAKGIRVNSIAPGFTRSEMTEGYFAMPTLEAAFCREIPLGRLGTVDDVANTALWLASDESRSTTGQVIDVTSGQSLRRTPTHEEMTH
jgi:NAD(P)-dependent dehydrogenase (short-subunit alcohol dehydrogenase family)